MLAFFRAITKSPIGAAIGLVFLALIALAFAGGDVSRLGTGSLIGGESVATVGSQSITTGDVQKTVRAAFDGERQNNPTLTMKQFLGEGALDQVVTGLIGRAATFEWGKSVGFGVSDALVDSEIGKIPAFQGPDGKFSEAAYKQLLTQRGLTDKTVRDDIAKGLMDKLVFAGALEGAVMPTGVAQRYAALQKEKRDGQVLLLPSKMFAPTAAPTDAQVADFYKANIARYNRPEMRAIRYAIIDDSVLKNVAAPSDADIAKRYQANAAQYAPSETRSITQVILPGESAAKAFAADMAGGKSIEAAAAAKGLSPAKVADKTHDQIAADTSKAVADAVFAAAQGKTAGPVKGAVGWVIARVDAVKKNPGKSLAEAKTEIAAAITAERHKTALTDLATRIGEQVEGGTGLADVAKQYGLSVTTTDPVTADGGIPTHPTAKLAPEVAALVQTAFAMDHEGQPQIAALPALPGQTGPGRVAVFDVSAITAAAPAPLASIKQQVAGDWILDTGSKAAAAAADKVLAALAKKQPLDAAAKAAGVALPPPQKLSMVREQLGQMQGRVPEVLAMLFSMPQGTSKKLQAPNSAGWVIVSLNTVTPGTVAANDPLVVQAASELAKITGDEMGTQMRNAITRQMGAKRNAAALTKVQDALTGGGQ